MAKRPIHAYLLVILYCSLSAIFLIWSAYAYSIFIQVPSWVATENINFVSFSYWIYLIGTVVWFGFAVFFMVLLYGMFKKLGWAWTTSLILTTLKMVIYSIMVITFMIVLVKYQSIFSVVGVITSTFALLIDICIVFLLTRPITKQYFNAKKLQ